VVARLAVDFSGVHGNHSNQGSRGFQTQLLPPAETRVALHAKRPFLYDFNQNWNVSTNFSKTSQYKITLKSVERFSGYSMRADRHGEPTSRIYASFCCELA
jgi:hypothetical protein